MSRTIRYKLTEEEFRVVLDASAGLGISVDQLAKQALAYTLSQARKLQASQASEVVDVSSSPEVDTTATQPGI